MGAGGLSRRARAVAVGLAVGVVALVTAAPASATTTGVTTTGVATAAPVARAADDGVPAGRVVLVGTSGLTWADVAGSPRLTALLDAHAPGSALGNLVVRSVGTTSCPADGWLALSAGTRVAGARTGDADAGSGTDGTGTCRPLQAATAGEGSSVPGWAQDVAAAADQDFDARLGVLGDAIVDHHVSATAIGAGAALALSTTAGTVAGDVVVPGTPDADGLARAVRDSAGSRLVVVDASPPAGATAGAPDEDTATAAGTTADRVAAALDAALAQPRTTVVLASVSDAPGADEPALQAVAVLAGGAGSGGAAAPGTPDRPAALTSSSTRTDGLVLTTDLLPTLARALGLDDAGPLPGIGAPLRRAGTTARASLVDAADRATASAAVAVGARTLLGVVIGVCVVAVTGSAALRRRRRLVASGAIILAALPVGTTLASTLPWWRAGIPGLGYAGAVTAWAVVVAVMAGAVGAAVRARRASASQDRASDPEDVPADARRVAARLVPLAPALVVAAVTWTVLAVDVVRGAPWQLANPLGTQPMLAGRFYGMNNSSFAFFAVATLVLVGGLGRLLAARRPAGTRGPALAGLALIGLAAVVVDGAPSLGADLGGPVALVPGLVMLLCAAAGLRMHIRHWVVTVAVAVGVVVLAAVADWARGPEHRTHLGGFVQQVLDGDAGAVLGRKVHAVTGILTAGWWSPLLVAAAVGVLWWTAHAWRRAVPGLADPANAAWVWAIPVTLVVAALVNDSGPSIPSLGLGSAAALLLAWDARRVSAGAPPSGAPRPDRHAPDGR